MFLIQKCIFDCIQWEKGGRLNAMQQEPIKRSMQIWPKVCGHTTVMPICDFEQAIRDLVSATFYVFFFSCQQEIFLNYYLHYQSNVSTHIFITLFTGTVLTTTPILHDANFAGVIYLLVDSLHMDLFLQFNDRVCFIMVCLMSYSHVWVYLTQ